MVKVHILSITAIHSLLIGEIGFQCATRKDSGGTKVKGQIMMMHNYISSDSLPRFNFFQLTVVEIWPGQYFHVTPRSHDMVKQLHSQGRSLMTKLFPPYSCKGLYQTSF